MIEPTKLYTTEEVAAILRRTPSSLSTARCRKELALPWSKQGGKVLYLGEDIIAYIKKSRVEVPHGAL